MTQLYDIWPNNTYCGPAVIAAVTGADCREVRGWINAVRGKRHNQGVCGLANRHLIGTLASRGYAMVPLEISIKCPMLKDFANALEPGVRYIINVTGHYVAMLDGKVHDSFFRFGGPLSAHKSRRQRVKKAWRIQ